MVAVPAERVARVALDRAATPREHLFRTWMGAVTLGEFVGFSVPAVAGAWVLGSATTLSLPVLVAAGAVEGAVLGTSQALVLRRVLPGLSPGRWVGVTAAGAAIAWALGLLPSATVDLWSRWPLPATVLAAALVAVLLVCSLGAAQWCVLRRHVAHAGSWVWGTALAWGIGLLVFTALTTPLWQPSQPRQTVVAIGALGGLGMATTMAGVSGLVLLHLLEIRPRSIGQRTQKRLVNPVVSAVLRSRWHRLLSGSTVLLTYAGWRTGRRRILPVMYAQDGPDLVLVAGAHRKKAWWRNFTQAEDVEVLIRGTRHRGRARRVLLFDAGYEHTLSLYRRRFPRARVAVGAPVIRVCLDGERP